MKLNSIKVVLLSVATFVATVSIINFRLVYGIVPTTQGSLVIGSRIQSKCYNAVTSAHPRACGGRGESECGVTPCGPCEQCIKTCVWFMSCWLDKKINEYHCEVTDRCRFGLTTKDEYGGPRITSLEDLLVPIAKILYYGGIFIGFCFIVYSGYAFMTSEGNPQKTQDAQDQLTAAVLGIIFILLAAAIFRVIINSLFGGNVSI